MAKFELKIKAREMRLRGESVKKIAKELGVSKGTVSIWVRDIILSVEQLEKLRQNSIKGGEFGRLKGSLMQKERRLKKIERYKKWGIKKIDQISDNEFFLSGIALYWAEGGKKSRKVQFCNSDPILINFMIGWLIRFFGVKKDQLKLTVGINISHSGREDVVKRYWSEFTNIPLTQFRKTSFKKSASKKVYDNFNEHYGTLSVVILKPGNNYYKILGLIDGLSSQGSSMVEHLIHKQADVGSSPTPGTN